MIRLDNKEEILMRRFYRVSFTIIIVLMIAVPNFSQTETRKNDFDFSKTHQDNKNCRPVLAFLRDVVSKANRTGGMAMTTNSCPENQIFPQLKPGVISSTEMNEMLDLIVRNNPNYVWKNEREVISLLPAKATPALLEVRIDYIKVSFDRNLSAVIDRS